MSAVIGWWLVPAVISILVAYVFFNFFAISGFMREMCRSRQSNDLGHEKFEEAAKFLPEFFGFSIALNIILAAWLAWAVLV